ncbi:MAG: beta-propeller domain-containing protein [Actinomycetota bacterium]|nr:beta-propeller domain-containing protein [Actinomycetota bacterium]
MADDSADIGTIQMGSRSWARSLGVATAMAIVLVAVPIPAGSHQHSSRLATPLRPAGMALVSYPSCDDLLAGLRANTARSLTAAANYPMFSSGLGIVKGAAGGVPATDGAPAAAAAQGSTAAQGLAAEQQSAPAYSTTNVQESGVDEPDIVKTDGIRIVTVHGGVLRVVNAATRKVTGTLTLSADAAGTTDQLLLAGTRALVILQANYPSYPAGGVGLAAPAGPAPAGPAPLSGPAAATAPIGMPQAPQSRYVLVDLSAQPKILGSLSASGDYVDARMIGTTVRLVNRSAPAVELPNVYNPGSTDSQRAAQVSAAVGRAPLSDWLPTYTVTMAGTSATRSVPCGSISHPATYSGTSLLTIYTFDLSKALTDASPMTLAADGTTVYGTQHALYIASTVAQAKVALERTEIHRFDLPAGGRPVYLGSATVPGRLLNQYSMSDFSGHLRVATTSGAAFYAGSGQPSASSSTVYVLDDETLTVVGSVSGLGNGQQIYAVRFVGPLAYVVTFQLTDPLYVLDLTNPANPRTSGELELTGYSNYLQPVGDGRLVGVGQEANGQGRVAGMQVSLFDVSSPSVPRRIGHVLRTDAPGENAFDPHSFLFWPATNMVIVPIETWTSSADAGKALVLRVQASGLAVLGLIGHPGNSQNYQPYPGIERTMVIGDSIWTLSPAGLLASELMTLQDRAWIPFS